MSVSVSHALSDDMMLFISSFTFFLDLFHIVVYAVSRMLTEVLHSACKDCVTRLLDKSDTLRLGSKTGASEVKQHKWFAKINWGLLRNTEPPVRLPIYISMSICSRFCSHRLLDV